MSAVDNPTSYNTTRAPDIKHSSSDVKDVCYFADRVRHMLDVKKNHLRTAMQKSDTYMIRISLRVGSRKNTGFSSK